MTRAAGIGLIGALLLSGCAATPPGVFRDASAQMGASTRFDRDGFAGSWIVVERFGVAPGDEIAFDTSSDAGTIRLSGTGAATVDGTYRPGVPGELIPVAPGRSPLVVMWVDEDFETAAIGTVSGSFGALIDRDGRVPPDRALAARAIFDFYGWDVSQLQRTGT
ncbi:MAG: hypothetical protein AAF999_14880 [Pseudomonadota bacterium]